MLNTNHHDILSVTDQVLLTKCSTLIIMIFCLSQIKCGLPSAQQTGHWNLQPLNEMSAGIFHVANLDVQITLNLQVGQVLVEQPPRLWANSWQTKKKTLGISLTKSYRYAVCWFLRQDLSFHKGCMVVSSQYDIGHCNIHFPIPKNKFHRLVPCGKKYIFSTVHSSG